MEKGCAVTLGFFDGVHRGHRYLLQQLEAMASANGLRAVVVTFDRHPRAVIEKDFVPLLLTTQEEKCAMLSESFCGEVVVIRFTQELSVLTAKEFMRLVLRDKLNAELLLMGYNHRFGHGGGTAEEYVAWGKELGIRVCIAEALAGDKVSSSRIRNLIIQGKIEGAKALLGYPYFLSGEITRGKQIGRRMGFPTANLSLPEYKLLPACGVYAVWAALPDGTKRDGMLCIGHRPTMESNGEISVEVHIFDFDGDLYGRSISVGFIEKIRDERQFDTIEHLRQQLTLDAKCVQEVILHSV